MRRCMYPRLEVLREHEILKKILKNCRIIMRIIQENAARNFLKSHGVLRIIVS